MNEMCEVKEGCALFIGRVGENLVTKLKFPIQDILETMPGAEIRLLFKRPGDLISYPVNSIIEDGELVWNVSGIDTAIKGWGKAELYAMEGEVVKLSIIHNVIVAESLLPEGAVPDPLQNWYQDIINASEQVENDRIIVQGIKSDVQEIKAAFELELVPINERLSEIEEELPSFATKQELQTETTSRVEAIDAIEVLIPDQASGSNQLADKDFVNSSISSNAAYFKGTFNSIEELEQVTDVTNNDYAYVIETDSAGNVVYNRYKYNSDESEWMFEYALNNSSFTAAQWATINSGITASNVEQIESNKNAIQQINVDLQNKANVNDVYSKTEADEEFSTKTELENGLSEKADAAEVDQLKGDIAEKADKTALAKTDRSLDMLWKLNQGITYTKEESASVDYEKQIPSGALGFTLDEIGGMTRKGNNLARNVVYREATNQYYPLVSVGVNFESGKTYSISFNPLKNSGRGYINISFPYTLISSPSGYSWYNPNANLITFVIKANADFVSPNYSLISKQDNDGLVSSLSNLMINEGSTALPYEPYFDGLKNAIVDEVEIKGVTTEPVTTPLPTALLSLPNYGIGINADVRNYVDFENKQYVQMCGSVDLGSLNWRYNASYGFYSIDNDSLGWKTPPTNVKANILCANFESLSWNEVFGNTEIGIGIYSSGIVGCNSTLTDPAEFKASMQGVMLYYELATPIALDITDILAEFDNSFECEGNGSITFKQTDETINIAVPNKETFVVKVSEVV